jgi:hypothetical protein
VGQEARCIVHHGGGTSEGKALLETDELLFRGDFRLKILLASITQVEASDGVLRVLSSDGESRFELGVAAAKWAERIRNPRTLVDKLDVKPTSRVAVLGLDDPEFLALLRSRAAEVHGEAGSDRDLIFLGVQHREDLSRLSDLKASLQPAGAIWTIRPKGKPEITERNVMEAAREAGLVDVKVARFSETHTAEKLVVPISMRNG